MGSPSAGTGPAPARGPRFETTQWTLVLAAGEGEDDRRARDALASLCRSYWHPVYAYLRARGLDRHEAEDVTQGFFARLIETRSLRHADRERGRFRSFLLASVKNYLSNERDRARALKRGGGRPPVRLDPRETRGLERRLGPEPAERKTPEDVYLEHWALTLLDRVMAVLGAEMRGRGREEEFEILKELLIPQGSGLRYQDVAARLDTSEGAIKVRVHRLRKRFGELLRREVAEVVESQDQVEHELGALLEAVAS